MRTIAAVAVAAVMTAPAAAQDGPKPGPEHDVLKKMAGTWDLTLSAGGMESKGTVVYKMDLGGLWLTSTLESELFGTKFSGRGLDSYDPAKKKYVSIWVDSMSASPLVMEGTYDAAKKTMTQEGTGPGPDGKPAKYKSVSETPDDNTIKFAMYMGGGTDPAFTILYKRKK
ncbi:MAG: DUF1579 domain-containing protein [Gemmataceae bacterium]|nr:DUF1579 domain-containing protein [Gemmataceae bacterium]